MSNNKSWFKPKKFGWGFTPITIQGWLLTFLLVVVVIATLNIFGCFFQVNWGRCVLSFVVIVLEIIVFSIISYKKCSCKK